MQLLFFRSLIVLCLLSFSLSVTCEAQYKENRERYNHREYVYQRGDRHPPFIAGVGSVFLPGFEHLIAGEPLRGLGFATGFFGSAAVSIFGLASGALSENPNASSMLPLGFAGLISTVAFYFYGISDAVKVAKVNSLAYRDRQKGLSWQFSPDLNSLTAQLQLNLHVKYTLGN